MKNLIPIIIILFISLFQINQASSQGFEWTASTISTSFLSNNQHSTITSVAYADDGFVYAVGNYTGNVYLDTVLLSASGVNNPEIFIAKFSSTGQLIWVKTAGGNGGDIAADIVVDNSGGVYICGYYEYTASFDTITVTATSSTANYDKENFVAKYDTAGNIIWVKKGSKFISNYYYYNYSYYDHAHLYFSDGFLYYATQYSSSQYDSLYNRTFDNTLLPIAAGTYTYSGASNFFVLKTSSTGVNSWIRPIETLYGNGGKIYPNGLVVNSNNKVIVQAITAQPWSVDTFSYNFVYNNQAYYQGKSILIELTDSGTYSNSILFDSLGYSSAYRQNGLAIDDDDNLYSLIQRYNGGNLVINGTLMPPYGQFIVKLNNALTPTKTSIINSSYYYYQGFDDLKVKGDELLLAGQVNGTANIAGTPITLNNELLFTSMDTSLNSINWYATSTTTNSTGNYQHHNSGVDFGANDEYYFSGWIGYATTSFGSYQFINTQNMNGYLTKIVKCYPIDVSVSPLNPVICGLGSSTQLNAGFNPSFDHHWLSSGNPILGGTNNYYLVNNPGPYSLEVDSLGCKDTSNVVNVVVSTPPTVTTPSSVLTVCSSAAPFVIPDGSPAGGTWTGTGVVNDTLFNPSITGIGPVLLTYTFSNVDSCSNSSVRTINVVAPPSLLVSGSIPSFCDNDSPYGLGGLVYPGGGDYSGTGISSNIFDPIAAGPGTHPVTYTYSAVMGCAITTTFNIVVNVSPTITFNTIAPLCESVNTLVLNTATPTGGTYTGLNTWNNTFYPNLAGAGSYQITYSFTQNGCSSSTSSIIQVDPPALANMTSIGPYCLNDTIVTLAIGSPIGGSYLIDGVTSTLLNPLTLGAGNHNLTYIYSNACGVDTTSQSFDIYGLPTVSLSAIGPFCENESSITLTQGTPFGGIYTGSGVINGQFNPALANIGANTLTYLFTDINSCMVSDSVVITVNAKPTSVITADSIICDGSSPIPLSVTPTGGTWTGSSGISGAIYNPSGLPVGYDTLQYVVSNTNNCSDTALHVINIAPIPVVNLSSFAPICNNSSAPILLAGGSPSGGVYSGSGVSSNVFNPSIAGTGIHLITYTYTDSNSCSAFDTSILVVDTTAIAITLSPFSNICADASSITLSGGNPTGGIYSGTGTSGGVFDPALSGAGTFTIYYSYAAPNSCLVTKSQTLQVDTLPLVSFSSIADACSSDTAVLLTTGTPFGGVYSGTSVSSNLFNALAAGSGTHQLVYIFTDGNNCISSDTQNVVVNAIPSVSTPSLPDACLNAGNVLLSGGLPSSGVYSGLGVTANYFDPLITGVGAQIIAYTFTDTNGCSNSAFDTISVNNATANLSSFTDVCADASSFTLTGGTPTGGTYTGPGVMIGQFDPSVVGVGNYTMVYTVNANGCVAADTQQLQVNALPNVWSNNYVDLCVSDTAYTLFTGAPNGGTYTGIGISGNQYNASLAGSGTHPFTYTFVDTNGCQSSVIDSMVVNALPSVNIPDFADMCVNNTPITLSGGLPINGIYTGNGITLGDFNPALADTGIHEITYNYQDSNGCVSSDIDTITVLPLPILSLNLPDSFCVSGTPVTLTGEIPTGGSYSGLGITAGIFTPSVPGIGVSNIVYTYTSSLGCTASDTHQITILAAPTVSLASLANACSNDSALVLGGGIPLGGVFSGNTVNNGLFYPGSSGFGYHSITYTYTDTNNCSSSANTNILVNAVTQPQFYSLNAICDNATPLTLTGGSPGGGIYSGTGVSNGQFNPLVTGAGIFPITYTYSNGNGCLGDSTINITVKASPLVTNPYNDTICLNNGLINLTGGLPFGGTFTGSPVTAGAFDPSINGIGTFDFIYTYTNNDACTSSDTGWFTVLDYPIINAGANQYICEGSSIVLTVYGTNTYLWSNGSIHDTANVSPTSTTNYTVTGTNLFGCSSTDTVTVNVNLNPVVNFGQLDSICADSVITIDGGAGYSNYNWSTSETTRFIDIGPYSAGNYVSISLIVTDTAGCFGQGSLGLPVVNCWPVSVQTISSEVEINLYPNPNNGNFNLVIADWKNTTLEISIISITGGLVYQETMETVNASFSKKFDVSTFANGVYWLIIKGENTTYRKKMIINK